MAYIKNQRAPLMYGLPTPVYMDPAMAGGEIEMDPDFAGKGANPNIVGEKPPPPMDVGAALKAVTGSVMSLFTPKPTTVFQVRDQMAAQAPQSAAPTLKDKLLRTGPLLLLVGGIAYFSFKKRS